MDVEQPQQVRPKEGRPGCSEGCTLLKECGKLCRPQTCYLHYFPAEYWSEIIKNGWSPRS